MNIGVMTIAATIGAGGRVSNYLHDQFQVGATIDLFPPSGAGSASGPSNVADREEEDSMQQVLNAHISSEL